MSRRFEQLVKNAETKKPESTMPTHTVTTSGRFGSSKFNITSRGPYTQANYQCIAVPCERASCKETLLNIIEPEYHLEVGVETSIPIELVFTQIEGKIRKGTVQLWSRHALATENIYSFKCPQCDHENKYVICKDEGLLILTVDQSHVEIPVPKNRIRFLSTPKENWNLEN